MITKIRRQEAIASYPNLPLRFWDADKEEDIDLLPVTFHSYVLTASSKSYRGHITQIAKDVVKLARGLNSASFIFLGDVDIPWRYRDSSAEKPKAALQYLTDSKIGKKFNGALRVNILHLPVFLPHLCWLIRTNTVLPYVHFTDEGQNFFASICQYGNIHLSTITSQSDAAVKKAVAQTGLLFMTTNCSDKYPQPVTRQ